MLPLKWTRKERSEKEYPGMWLWCGLLVIGAVDELITGETRERFYRFRCKLPGARRSSAPCSTEAMAREALVCEVKIWHRKFKGELPAND